MILTISVHFVGNRALLLGDGEDEIQLYYSPVFSAVSAILPIVVVFVGLVVADRFHKGSKHTITRFASLLVCAVCAGAAAIGMFCLENIGATNYYSQPSWPLVIGAAGIAFGVCLISFGLFFHWAKHWMNSIWSRVMVACVLAAADSAMHWTAVAGTRYEIRDYHEGGTQERNTNLIISICIVSSLFKNMGESTNNPD